MIVAMEATPAHWCQACVTERSRNIMMNLQLHRSPNGCLTLMTPERFRSMDLDYLFLRATTGANAVYSANKVMARYYEMISLDQVPISPDCVGKTPLVIFQDF